MVRPDYSGGGFLNLIASITEACGARPRHPPLAALAPGELSTASNLVLLIIDGLGERYLQTQGPASSLARRERSVLSAVFPSTTAAAITTSYTGYAPIEHGLTGWFTYFSEAGCVVAPLPGRTRGDEQPLAARGVGPARLFLAPSLLDTLALRSIVISPGNIVDSDYNRHHCGRAERHGYADRAGLVARVEAAVKSCAERKFVYAYWPQFDTLAHRHGVASAEVRAEFAAIDAAFAELLDRLAGSDTILVATADHGFVDSGPAESLELADSPGLAGLLRFPLCGERRIAFCHVQEGRVREFSTRARAWLDGKAEVRLSRDLAGEGWLGYGVPHPRLAERIGDVALLMGGRYTIKDWTPGEPRHPHIGNHGGASGDEMLVPLIVAEL